MAGSQLSGVYHCPIELSVVTVCEVIGHLYAEVDIAGLVVNTRVRLLITIGNHHGAEVVVIVELRLVIELRIEENGLVAGAIRDVLHTRVLVVVVLGQARDDIHAIVVGPRRLIDSIGIAKVRVIGSSVVHGELRLERQALHEAVQVHVQAHVKLELASGIGILTGRVEVTKHIGLVYLRTREEILAVDDVGGCSQQGLRGGGILGYIADGDEGSHTVRTERGGRSPVVRAHGALLVVEHHLGMQVGGNPVVDVQVHVTAEGELVGIVLLALTELEDIGVAIVVDVGIETRVLATTRDVDIGVDTGIGLLDIVAGVEVHVGITVGIQSRGVVVDVLCAVEGIQIIVDTRLVVERHVLSRA